LPIEPKIGVGRQAVVAAVTWATGQRDPLAGLHVEVFESPPWKPQKAVRAAGLLPMRRNRFGTNAELLVNASNVDLEASGAASRAGIERRDMMNSSFGAREPGLARAERTMHLFSFQ